MSTNETTAQSDVLEHVAASCSQVELDYFIYCVCTHKKDAAYNAMIESGISVDRVDAFIEEVDKLHADDVQKVLTVQQVIQMTDEDLIDLAQTILRVLM